MKFNVPHFRVTHAVATRTSLDILRYFLGISRLLSRLWTFPPISVGGRYPLPAVPPSPLTPAYYLDDPRPPLSRPGPLQGHTIK